MARTEHQKELLAAYRERPITGAVCAVTDTVNGKTLLLASPNPAGQRNRFGRNTADGSGKSACKGKIRRGS